MVFKPRVSNESIIKRTGKSWKQWFSILDSVNAKNLPHIKIRNYLMKQQNVTNAWYAQLITNTYEQARNIRKKHEMPDGFQISVSKIISSPLSVLFKYCYS